MFANAFQSGFLSIFYSVGSNPLSLWDKQVKNGHIRRVIDEEVKSLVLEVSGTNVATTYITCPIKPRASLGIKLPFLVMIIKNMKKYFTFEIQILDDKDMHRRFRVSNFQSTTKVRPFCTTMPIGLSSGWNQVQFNLADFTKRAYGSTYLETTRVQIHANVRIRRIYFADQLYSDEDMPNEFKLFVPVPGQPRQPKQAPKKSASDTTKGRGAKQPSDAQLKRKSIEEEIPSGAPPSPAELTRREETAPAEEEPEVIEPEQEPPAEAAEAEKAESVEKITEATTDEEGETVETPTTEVTESETTEAPAEPAAEAPTEPAEETPAPEPAADEPEAVPVPATEEAPAPAPATEEAPVESETAEAVPEAPEAE